MYQYTGDQTQIRIRSCAAYGEPQPLTSHALGELAGRLRTTLSWRAAARRHGRHLDSMTSYQKSDSVNRCLFTRGTILPTFIPIRLEMMEPHRPFLQRSPKHLQSLASWPWSCARRSQEHITTLQTQVDCQYNLLFIFAASFLYGITLKVVVLYYLTKCTYFWV